MKYCVMNHMVSHMHAITIMAGLEITFSDHADISWTLSNILRQTQVLTGYGNVHNFHVSFCMNKMF